MKTPFRQFLLAACLPPVLSALFVPAMTLFTLPDLNGSLIKISQTVWFDITHGFLLERISIWLKVFLISLIGSLMFSGIQSIVYSLIMNLYVLKEIKKSRNIILISSLLGGVSIICVLLMFNRGEQDIELTPFDIGLLCLGLIVGALSGYLLLKFRNSMLRKMQSQHI